ncbi:MAG: type II toxin-antitoxin system VapC family toxin [Gemmatimonadales bacterium]|nr:type II toxin-antitoxin system VapC family toxin [Gemmatimonadales bacterium]
MIAYLDASALVKRYLLEPGSRETLALTAESEMVATSIISRAEVAAAFAKAVRLDLVTEHVARKAQRSFDRDWQDLLRVPITEALIDRARTLAWNQALRGYDAVQLASALMWQESIGTDVVVGTFDRQLWTATRQLGMKAWPEDLTGLDRIHGTGAG